MSKHKETSQNERDKAPASAPGALPQVKHKETNQDKRAKAIENNHRLYEAVFAPQGIDALRTALSWHCLQQTPPLYSNLVTRSPDWRPDQPFRQIDRRFVAECWDEWSIKDSFATLDLRAEGFVRLFDATWLYLNAIDFQPLAVNPTMHFRLLKTPEELAHWRRAWDPNESPGEQIFTHGMLQDPDISFVAGYAEDTLTTGCLLNRSDDVIGISNFFSASSTDKTLSNWSMVVEFVQETFGPIDIVGYEQGEAATQLQRLGFAPVGPLTIWLKRRSE